MGLFPRRARLLLPVPHAEAAGTLRVKVGMLAGFIVLLFGILTIQLVRLQLLQSGEFEQRATSNRLRLIDTPAQRGLIYARDGTPLVDNIPSFAITVVPADVPEDAVHRIAEEVGRLLAVPTFEIETKILEGQRSIDPFQPVLLDADTDRDLAFTVASLTAQWPGVEVSGRAKRQYLHGDLLANILGYVGPITREEFEALRAERYGLADMIGQTGVEAAYEATLRGVAGRRQVEVNGSGRELRALAAEAPTPGQGLELAIDVELQRAVRDILQASMGGSRYAVAVVVDVYSGEVLSMVSLPSYNNNLFSGALDAADLEAILTDEGRPLVNHAIADQFPPGSIFKVITGSAALAEGVIDAQTKIYSPGVIEVQNAVDARITYTFRDTTSGDFNFITGMAESSNVYFWYLSGGSPYRRPVPEELLTPEAQTAQETLIRRGVIGGDQEFIGLGADRLSDWSRRFGLGSPTGIDLVGEAAGFVPDADWKMRTFGEGWGQGDSYNFGIGQGFVAVTPLQMAMVTAAIANGGDLLQPQVVREIRDEHGAVVQPFRRKVIRHLDIAPEYLQLVREGMARAVLAGTAGNAWFPEMQVAGKTGTAEFGTEPSFRGLFPTHGWFIGFAPYPDPQVAVVVFQELGAGFLTAEAGGQILRAWGQITNAFDPAHPAPPQRSSLDDAVDGNGNG